MNSSKCSVCKHKAVSDINRQLLEKTTLREISEQYGLTIAALHRHNHNHLPKHLLKATELQETTAADSLVDRLTELRSKADDIFVGAKKKKNYQAAAAALREQRAIIELYCKLIGELSTTTNIVIMPEWITLRTTILKALEPYPEAQQAIVKALGYDAV